MKTDTKLKLLRAGIALAFVLLIAQQNSISDFGTAIFVVPALFFAIYIWLGVAFFVCDLVWMLFTKPDQRLFATVMLGSALMVLVVLAAAYWLIHDSIGLGGTIVYAFGAYFMLSIVQWFRRHTASYYATLEAEQQNADPSSINTES
ncbi:MAG: hypothetical protein AAGF25_13570 [Pseudomonadota bacterium]